MQKTIEFGWHVTARIIAEAAGADPHDLAPNTDLAEIGVEGLERAKILIEVEARYEVAIDDELAASWESVMDVHTGVEAARLDRIARGARAVA